VLHALKAEAEIIKGIFPDDCLARMNDRQFCFVHIDVDVYQSARDIVAYVWPKMPVGALAVFDDYGFESCDGVAKLVDGYRSRPDMLVIHNLNGHAIIAKIG
jgi:O-methyltransferase